MKTNGLKLQILAVLAILLLSGCGTTEPDPPPDFYDRNGVACWQFADMVWCEDGYESRAEFQVDKIQYHIHTWFRQSTGTDRKGKLVCTWQCVGNVSHTAITSGWGRCPYPN